LSYINEKTDEDEDGIYIYIIYVYKDNTVFAKDSKVLKIEYNTYLKFLTNFCKLNKYGKPMRKNRRNS
jgi:hypothetical protein